MLPFHPARDLVDARVRLRDDVRRALDAVASGRTVGAAERQAVDFKEEAGRRGAGGVLLDGQPQNLAAADALAKEVACLANTPAGGALVVGVEDSTGALLGTELDEDWLRQRIYQRVEVAPAIESVLIDGTRLLVLYVAASREPVEDQDGKLRWRTGGSCQPVDRAEWWLHRQDAAGSDPMAAVTERTVLDVPEGALTVARRYLRAAGGDDVPASPEALLTWLGVRRPDGRLTQAGALAFCASDRTWLSMAHIEVEGGDVLATSPDLSGRSLLEQLAAVEDRLEALNTATTVAGGFAEHPIRQLPPRAVREAVLNGMVHRDWLQPDPVSITWVEADSALQVVSPGGFVGGISADNVLTQRYARSPALADLFSALRLIDKRGMGVDRMVREMLALGHRRPLIVEEPGPRVRTRLVGGLPVLPVMNLMSRIEPSVRRRDVRVALIVHELLHEPFVTAESMAAPLQRSPEEAEEALRAASACRIAGQPLLTTYKDVHVLSSAALSVVDARGKGRVAGLLPYRRPSEPAAVVRRWLRHHDRISSGDHATLTGLTQTGALRQLERLTGEEVLSRGTGLGRNAHFTAGPALRTAVSDLSRAVAAP